jgi:LemA protein
VLAIVAVWGYNSLRNLHENVKEAKSNIEVALRKKISLTNQLIDLAMKYMDRESLVQMKISQDTTAASMQQMYQQTGTVLSTIQGMAQKFPDLKTSQQYMALAPEIAKCEEDLQMFRMMCNSAIKEYNKKRSSMPTVFYAGFVGFRPERYLELESTESTGASVQREISGDDGERINELLGMAGSKMLGATKTLAEQGKLLAEKAATRVQSEIAARSAGSSEYHYLDANRNPMGPVSRQQLDALFISGQISQETDVLAAGSKSWTKYQSLQSAGPEA